VLRPLASWHCPLHSCTVPWFLYLFEVVSSIFTRAPISTGDPGAAPGGVTSKNG